MRSLDDKKVSQVSQFVEMTSRTGFHLVTIIPFNYTPDLCVSGVMLFFAFLEADIGFWYSNIISAAIHAAIIYIFKKLKIRGTFSLFIIFSQNQFPLLYRPIGDKQITSATMPKSKIRL